MYQTKFTQKVPGGGGLCFQIQYDPAEVMPWCCQYGGGGHYYQSGAEAVEYARRRKWITRAQAESIIRQLDEERDK